MLVDAQQVELGVEEGLELVVEHPRASRCARREGGVAERSPGGLLRLPRRVGEDRDRRRSAMEDRDGRPAVERREVVERLVRQVSGSGVRALGDAHLAALAKYEADARAAGAAFVEIQHTMLFATVGSAS